MRPSVAMKIWEGIGTNERIHLIDKYGKGMGIMPYVLQKPTHLQIRALLDAVERKDELAKLPPKKTGRPAHIKMIDGKKVISPVASIATKLFKERHSYIASLKKDVPFARDETANDAWLMTKLAELEHRLLELEQMNLPEPETPEAFYKSLRLNIQ